MNGVPIKVRISIRKECKLAMERQNDRVAFGQWRQRAGKRVGKQADKQAGSSRVSRQLSRPLSMTHAHPDRVGIAVATGSGQAGAVIGEGEREAAFAANINAVSRVHG